MRIEGWKKEIRAGASEPVWDSLGREVLQEPGIGTGRWVLGAAGLPRSRLPVEKCVPRGSPDILRPPMDPWGLYVSKKGPSLYGSSPFSKVEPHTFQKSRVAMIKD
jgi:hypothetical protein